MSFVTSFHGSNGATHLYAMKSMQTYSKIEPAYADITYVYLVKKL